MKKHNLAFIDIETTGLNPDKHEILEIGCIIAKQIEQSGRGSKIEKIDEFEIKIKPTHIETADKEALRICGYDESLWLFATDLKKAMVELSKRTENSIIVGHNVSFDWAFLEKAYESTGVSCNMDYHKIDTVALAYAVLYNNPEIQKFSLRSLCEHFGIKNEKAHTALSDIRATYDLYKILLDA